MILEFSQSKLAGKIAVPPSKSFAHRSLICASLAKGESVIKNIELSQDITATINALTSLGAVITVEGNTARVKGIETVPSACTLDCHESGSTLRFLIPVASALGAKATFIGCGKLPQRPITPFVEQMSKYGVTFDYKNTMPFEVSGKLESGIFTIKGDISSQFITGLLFALPILEGDSEIIIEGVLQSKPYVDMTIDVLKVFGIEVDETKTGYKIKGGQQYRPSTFEVEGDYSQAAFFVVANAINSQVEITNLNPDSTQGDKEIVKIASLNAPFEIDASNIPDLVPILSVLACSIKGKSVIKGAERLRIKECDRLSAMATNLCKLGGNVKETADGLEIIGGEPFKGGTVDSFNDHRIAMSMAIAALYSKGKITLTGPMAINKSYPGFYRDYESLGGVINVINVE